MGVGGKHHTAATLTPPPKDIRYAFYRGWVGPRAGLDGYEKSRPPLGFDPRTL